MRRDVVMLLSAVLTSVAFIGGCQTSPAPRTGATGAAHPPQTAPPPPGIEPPVATGPVDAAASHRDALRGPGRRGTAPPTPVADDEDDDESAAATVVSPMLGTRVVTRPADGGNVTVERAPRARSLGPAGTAPTAAPGGTHRIVLKRTFIDHVKDRATITTMFTPIGSIVHGVASDADEHISGLAEEPVMTMVAEIMNAAEASQARAKVETAITNADSVEVTGVWRLWCEHPGSMDHVQDATVPDYSTFAHITNPDHVYEMHPVTRFDGTSLLGTLHPIGAAYPTKGASAAFDSYDKLRCTLSADQKTVTIRTKTIGNNYPEFWLRIDESPTLIADGQVLLGTPLDTHGGEVTDGPRRMVFVKNSPPEIAVRTANPGDVMHVLGMPRVDLGVIAERVATGHLGTGQTLPYEIVIVGVYDH